MKDVEKAQMALSVVSGLQRPLLEWAGSKTLHKEVKATYRAAVKVLHEYLESKEAQDAHDND
jgi:hypothetical protein